MNGLFAFCHSVNFRYPLPAVLLSCCPAVLLSCCPAVLLFLARWVAVLAFSDIATVLCRQVETYNVMILFDKNHFGLSRRYKATYLLTSGGEEGSNGWDVLRS